MGIDARIESEPGEAIEVLYDLDNLVKMLLPYLNDKSSIYLRFIYPYGNTTFNQSQLPVVIRELTLAIIDKASSLNVIAHGQKLLDLAENANGQAHNYLKFVGD